MLLAHVDSGWSESFPQARMGLLEARNLPALSRHPALDSARQALEADLRERYAGMDRKGLKSLPEMQAFELHFKPFGKTYHVLLQRESVALKGRSIPARICAVTALFMAELKHGLVAAGHDLDRLHPPLRLAPALGGERYRGFNGVEICLPKGDMTLRDERGLLSSVLYGPDGDTPIHEACRNVLYTIYEPVGLPKGTLEAQLEDLAGYVRLFAPDSALESQIIS